MKATLISLTILFSAGCSFTYAQTITTIAGIIGAHGYTGDGGPATSAKLSSPQFVAADNAGNVYITDQGNYVIRKVSPAGIISTVAGNGALGYYDNKSNGKQATSVSIGFPDGIAVDKAGNLYIADNSDNLILQVNTSGIISLYAGTSNAGNSGDGGPATAAMLYRPMALAVDNSGNLYISEAGINIIRKVNAAGIISTFAGNGSNGYSGDGGQATLASIGYPWTLATDNLGNVYIGDNKFAVIRKVNAAGIITTMAGTGKSGYSGDGGPAIIAQLDPIMQIAADNAGSVYITDFENYTIRKIDAGGIITTFAGTGQLGYSGDGGPAILAQLTSPAGIAADNAGHIYFTEHDFCTVRKITYCMPVSFSTPPVDENICENSKATFSVISLNADTYQWQVNDGSGWNNITDNSTYSGAPTNTLTISQAVVSMTNYQYRCAATNTCSTNYSLAGLLTVAATPAPAITIAASTNDICSGTPVTFTATTTNGGTDPLYQWQVNGAHAGANSADYTSGNLNDGDIVSCIFTSSLGCASPVTSTNNIVMNIKPTPAVSVTADTTIKQGSTVQLNASATGLINNYQWLPATDLNDQNIFNPTTRPVNTITYQVTATATDGCSGYGKVTITVLKKIVMPNAFTPNGDGKNDVFRIPAGILFNLKTFSIFDRWGNLVFQTKDITQGWNGTFNGQPANMGTYVFMITGSSQNEKVALKGTVELLR
jgi:gliding motility-associated-like protein